MSFSLPHRGNAPQTRSISDRHAGPAADAVPVIEIDAALRRMGGNSALFVKVADYFIKDSVGMIADLQDLLREGAISKAASVVHTLKGLAGTVGAQSLAVLAYEVEMQLKASEPPMDFDLPASGLVEALETANAALAIVIEQLRAETAG